MQRERVVPVSIALPPTLARRVRVLAAQSDKSRSQFVREALEAVLARIESADRQHQAHADRTDDIDCFDVAGGIAQTA